MRQSCQVGEVGKYDAADPDYRVALTCVILGRLIKLGGRGDVT